MIAASSAGMIGFGRGASTDMLVSAPFALAMMCWWSWASTSRKFWLLLLLWIAGRGRAGQRPCSSGAGRAGGWARTQSFAATTKFFCAPSPSRIRVVLCIVLPWYLAVQHKVPQFFASFFIEHNLERFGTNLYQHAQPFWYYIPVFVLATLPWTVFALPALFDAGRVAIKLWRGC